MTVNLSKLPKPILFAHRGASAYAPENTMAAFDLALEQGAVAIEFDVKLSKDREIVVIHDQTVNRTTNATGNVSRLPLADLRELDAGAWFGAEYRREKIPTLHEVFAAFGDQLLLNIELTNYATPFDALVPKVVDLIKRYKVQHNVYFSSFYPHNLMRAAQLLPDIPRAQLIWPGRAGAWQRIWARSLNIQAEHPWKGDVTAESIQKTHERNRRIHTWTVNTPEEIRHLKTLGVDGIITDDIPTALKITKSRNR